MKNELLEKIFKGNKNLIVEGQLSSGKTTNVLFPVVDKLIDNNESLVILDSKEEYLNKYYKKLKDNGYNTIIINLRDPNNSEGWNPLEYPYELYKSGNKDDSQELLESIGKGIFYDKNSVDPFWTDSAKDFFTGLCLGLFEDGKEDEINFNSINNMFYGIGKKFGTRDYINCYFDAKGVKSKAYIFASSTILSPKETQGGILSTARQKLRLYISRDRLSKLLSKTTFDFKDIVNKKSAIFIIGKDEANNYVNQIVSMFVEQLYSILVNSRLENSFNIILDNIDSVDRISSLSGILSSCISRNIKTFIATRSLIDLIKDYGTSINFLSDLVKINNNDISLIFNNIEESIEKDFERVIISKDELIEYPKLSDGDINTFDLEKFVQENVKLNGLDNPFKQNSVNIDELISKIDKKIEEFEKDDKDIPSVFEGFKY